MLATDLINLQPLLDKIAQLEQRVLELEKERDTKPEPGPEWLTVAETAELLGVTPGSVHRYANQKLLKKYRAPSGSPRFKRSEVENFFSRKIM